MSVPLVHGGSKPVVLFTVLFGSTLSLSSLYTLTERTRKSHAFINATRIISFASASILAIVPFSCRLLLVLTTIECLAFGIRSSINPMYRRNQVLLGSPPPISSSYFSLNGSSLELELGISVNARPVHVQNTKERE